MTLDEALLAAHPSVYTEARYARAMLYPDLFIVSEFQSGYRQVVKYSLDMARETVPLDQVPEDGWDPVVPIINSLPPANVALYPVKEDG